MESFRDVSQDPAKLKLNEKIKWSDTSDKLYTLQVQLKRLQRTQTTNSISLIIPRTYP